MNLLDSKKLEKPAVLHLFLRYFEIMLPVFVNATIIFQNIAIYGDVNVKNPHKSADFLRASFSSTQFGGPEEIRPIDLCVANAAISQSGRFCARQ